MKPVFGGGLVDLRIIGNALVIDLLGSPGGNRTQEPQKLQAVNVIGQPPHIPFHVSVNVTGIEDGGIGISSCDQGRHPALMDTLKDLWRVQHLASVLPF